MRHGAIPAVVALVCGLGGCTPPDNAPGPGEVTMGEARALDDAAAMLDSRKGPVSRIAPDDQPSASASVASHS